MKIGTTVTWRGKVRTVDGERCTDENVHELRLSWCDASGHLRRGWVPAAACEAVSDGIVPKGARAVVAAAGRDGGSEGSGDKGSKSKPQGCIGAVSSHERAALAVAWAAARMPADKIDTAPF